MQKIIVFLAAASLIFSACKNEESKPVSFKEYFAQTDSGVQTGGVKLIPIETPVGKFNVWVKRIGNNPRIKVLLLHGGPACTHEYMESFESFFPQEGIEFYEYDQLGSFYSDQPKDSSLWTSERFVEEVEQVRKALHLDNTNFYLLGHSWGGILAIEYALKYQQHLKGLIISNMTASFTKYNKYNADVLRPQMRKSLRDSLDMYEQKNDLKNPVYVDLVTNEFYKQHICRLPEWPDAVVRTFKHLNEEIYVMMQGPSEFKGGGRLINWERWEDMKKITVPTLTIGAKYDSMNPEEMEAMSKNVKNGRFLFCPDGSHMDMWDDQQHYFPGLIKFLKDVDEGKAIK
jgi:proline iminopeptidase